jgi:hypothetical protein
MTAEISESFEFPLVALVAAGADPPTAIKSVTSDLLDQALSEPRTHTTRQEAWVEDNSPQGGHWEVVS